MSLRITGKLPSGSHASVLKQSKNFAGKAFQNLSPTPMMAEDASYWKMVCDFFRKNKSAAPPAILPSVKTDLSQLQFDSPAIVWFGHSSYLIRVGEKNFLIDPVFSGYAAPLSFMVKAFPGSDIYKSSDMPEIDYLILTHDHYDHLDYSTIRQLKGRVKRIYCSLGISSHLVYWGMDPSIITEMDWWDETILDDGVRLIAAPARHFSGRGLTRARTLWSSFILKTGAYTIYIGGDSGYDTHFKTIGEKYGPFDTAILEAGQYNKMWPLIHMMPEETVQAALDLKAEFLLPVHWGKFSLAMHAWNEPVTRVLARARQLSLPVVTPRIGEPVILGKPFVGDEWWQIE